MVVLDLPSVASWAGVRAAVVSAVTLSGLASAFVIGAGSDVGAEVGGAEVGGAWSCIGVDVGVGFGMDLREPALAAASAPACRIAIASGVSSFLREEAGLEADVSLLGSDMEM